MYPISSPNRSCVLKLVELSKAQDVEAGDGTTSVVIIAGSLLSVCLKLLEKGKPAIEQGDGERKWRVSSPQLLRITLSPLDLLCECRYPSDHHLRLYPVGHGTCSGGTDSHVFTCISQ